MMKNNVIEAKKILDDEGYLITSDEEFIVYPSDDIFNSKIKDCVRIHNNYKFDIKANTKHVTFEVHQSEINNSDTSFIRELLKYTNHMCDIVDKLNDLNVTIDF